MQVVSQSQRGSDESQPSASAVSQPEYVIRAGGPLDDEALSGKQHAGGGLDPSVTVEALSRARVDSRTELLLTFCRR
jgi:hypothetical protein